jgi:uncharacterized protein (TIGR02466 family)
MYTDFIFPTPIGITTIDPITCKKYSDLVKELKHNGKCHSNNVGMSYTTSENLMDNENFGDLSTIIISNVNELVEDVYGVSSNDINMKSMWANIHLNYSKHHFHNHANSFISGVIYLDVPVECEHPGLLNFTDPRPAKHSYHADYFKESCLSDRTWVYKPITGLMCVFPGWLEHGTDEYVCSSDNPRVSLSFNFSLNKCSSLSMRI